MVEPSTHAMLEERGWCFALGCEAGVVGGED